MKPKENPSENAFLRQLAQYSALGSALIGSANQAQAAIQYAALSGNTVSNSTEVFNLPGGGVMNFIEETHNRSVWVSIGGGVSVSGTASAFFPNARDAAFLVSASGAWHPDVTQFLGYQGGNTGGNFLGTSGKFLAFRFNNGGIKYGWLRMNLASDASSFTLVDWAYQDDGTPILTGDMGGLPVELLSFDAKALKQAVNLEWATSREEGFEGFSLERATDGGTFAEIAWLPGQGNSTETRAYSYQDEAITENTRYYYRLKSVDLNGSFEYSRVVEAAFNPVGFSILPPYPNPVTDAEFRLEIWAEEAETVQLKMFSATGQCVYEEKQPLLSGKNEVSVAVPHLSGGVYFLKVQGKYYSSYQQVVVQ